MKRVFGKWRVRSEAKLNTYGVRAARYSHTANASPEIKLQLENLLCFLCEPTYSRWFVRSISLPSPQLPHQPTCSPFLS